MEKDLPLLSHEDIYSGKLLSLFVEKVKAPSGTVQIREIVKHPGGAVVIGLFPDETLLLIRQYRFAVGSWLWELPAGKLDFSEDPLHAAIREFNEETGYAAVKFSKLAHIYTTPGFCSEILHIFLATGLTKIPGGQKLEESEQTLTVHRFSLSKVLEMIAQGEIMDGKTICGVLLVAQQLHKHSM